MKLSVGTSRTVRALALALAVSIAPAAPAAHAAAPSSDCATQWGSQVKHSGTHSTRQVTDVRSGRHTCFDRLVVDIGGHGRGRPGWWVGYVPRVVMDGSGHRVPLRGDARIQVVINAPAYGRHGAVTYDPADPRELVDVGTYDTFRQVAWAGTFEGQTTLGLGVRARLPLRVFVLDDPSGRRLVIDVAHSWS
ncbi:hypothetical protein F0U44_05010 [Nocardioides humilatus]|uniref:AMIN-like domain-containing protein n=1 Tax=Nocardioides humilatus TaxID=2607660 RepID=A0A5B1LPQ5_9ACTN|nr:hypothetical protein [Nocardioides humilatus]KAA1421639.1 hypothetical protein F0U44_05010 [Nocardioides humilatus]